MKSIFKSIIRSILTWEAQRVLKKYKPKIVAITGSVGKTSTKDALFTVLKHITVVARSEKSFNSELGIPLSILGLPNGWGDPVIWIKNILKGLGLILFAHEYPKMLVLEVGADKPGDISSVASWLKPDVAVITRFPEVPVHIEFFSSKEEVIEEKSSLAYNLKKGGLLVLNGDDKSVMELSTKVSGVDVVTYGFGENATLRADPFTYTYTEKDHKKFPKGLSTSLTYKNETKLPMVLEGTISESQVYCVLPAILIATVFGCDFDKAIKYGEEYTTPPGRLALIEGVKLSLILDDTYNASPIAVENALKTLAALEVSGRRIAVLGDMMELGKYTEDEHRKIGKLVAELKIDHLITVGSRSSFTAEEAIKQGMSKNHVAMMSTSIEAGTYVHGLIASGDVVLVKGSQSPRLERVVKAIMAYPEEAKAKLVRQDEEWARR